MTGADESSGFMKGREITKPAEFLLPQGLLK
jgi:hypothetical protein